MRLTRIEAQNLKGRSFAYDLAPLQLILADNFKGKTAIIEAIRLALLGHIPEIGKTNAATWELSSGQTMKVIARLDVEQAITREFWLDGQTVKARMHTNDGPKPVQGISPEDLINLPLLNSEHYFSLTDTKAVEYAFSKIKLPESYTKDGIIARLQQLSFEEEHTEAIEKSKNKTIGTIRALLVPDNGKISEGIVLAKDACAREFTYWNKREKETQGTVAILTELKNRAREVTPGRVKQLDDQIAVKHAAIRQLNQRLGEVRQQILAWEKSKAERTVMEKTLGMPVIGYAETIDDLRKKCEALKPAVAAAPGKMVDRSPDLRAERNAAQTRLDTENKDIKEAKEELEKLAKMPGCPFCKSKGRDWRKELDAYYNKLITNAQSSIKRLEPEVARLSKELTVAVEERDENLKLYAAGEDAKDKARDYANRMQLLETEQKHAKQTRTELEERYKALPPLGDKPDTNSVQVEMDKVAGEAADLTKRRTEAVKLQQDLKRAAEAAIEHGTAAAHVKVIKAIGKELVAIQAEMIDSVFGELLLIANKIVRDILPSSLQFFNGEVGRWTEGKELTIANLEANACGLKFIPHRVFSGTEKALTYVAIAAALSSQAPLRLLILDEIGRLDKGNQIKVLDRLAAAVEDNIIDQVIVAGTEVVQPRGNWAVISL